MNPEKKRRANSKAPQERDEVAQFKHLVRQAMPPVSTNQLEPRTDLWPQLRARIDSQLAIAPTDKNPNREPSRIRANIPWFDWALAALAAAALFFFPGIIPALLYHF